MNKFYSTSKDYGLLYETINKYCPIVCFISTPISGSVKGETHVCMASLSSCKQFISFNSKGHTFRLVKNNLHDFVESCDGLNVEWIGR